MLLTIYTILVVLLLFGLTIFVHELGHFLVARWCGMVAEVFSIGFGPALWKRKIGGVIYKIGALPFGGYVALPQMDPSFDQGAVEKSKALPRVSPGRKILVALAGVTGNVLFAILLAYVIYWVGKPSSPEEWNTIVGYVDPASAVYEKGLRIGDEILTVNGKEVGNWNDINTECALSQGVVLRVRSEEGFRSIEVPTEKSWLGIRVLPGVGGENYCKVGGVVAGSSAESAGIRAQDLLVEFDGVPLHSTEHLVQLVQQRRDRETPVRVRRGTGELILRVTPRADAADGPARIGVQFNTLYVDSQVIVHPKPWSQLRNHASLIFRFLRALLTPQQTRAAAQGVGGPPAILFMFWLAVKSSIMIALWFTCLLNINLAILNLLPIPILDGGHIIFSLYEAAFRRPVSPRVVAALSNVFATLLIVLFVFLSYRDIRRLILPAIFKSDKPPAEQPAAPPAPEPAVP